MNMLGSTHTPPTNITEAHPRAELKLAEAHPRATYKSEQKETSWTNHTPTMVSRHRCHNDMPVVPPQVVRFGIKF